MSTTTEMKVDTTELERLQTWMHQGLDLGSRYPAMSYEDGMKDMLEVLSGEMTVEDLIGEKE